MTINYTQACKLRDALLEYRSLADFHSVPSAELAVRVCHEAGLATAYIPLANTTRNSRAAKYNMHLAVVDPQRDDTLRLNSDKEIAATKVYCLTRLVPLTTYAADLVEIDLTKLWWAAPDFFYDMTHALANWTCDQEGGRSHWGDQMRTAFATAFEQQWNTERVVTPAKPVPPTKLRFTYIPALAAPATAGDG